MQPALTEKNDSEKMPKTANFGVIFSYFSETGNLLTPDVMHVYRLCSNFALRIFL